ncbi:hypothetical protein E2C01_055804 [Portunus trituberculatus]|uniref:Uncharacterized protein n=1 Tax=Portunus trituberculatus TaxID=210409 RepID=A0A5B7GW15_PORTR|nr:hypothetical protein [Portunus trituberculatus]
MNSGNSLGMWSTAVITMPGGGGVRSRKRRGATVVGVLRHQRGSEGYEEMRQKANRKIHEGMLGKMKTCKDREDYDVNFPDLDEALQAFNRDRIHLSWEGEKVICSRIHK